MSDSNEPEPYCIIIHHILYNIFLFKSIEKVNFYSVMGKISIGKAPAAAGAVAHFCETVNTVPSPVNSATKPRSAK